MRPRLVVRPVFLLAAIGLAMSFAAAQASAQEIISKQDALSELSGVYVMGGDVDDVLAAGGLQKEMILLSVISDLTNGQLLVLDEEDWLMVESAPVLYIDLSSSVGSNGQEMYGVRVEVLYLVNPVSNPLKTMYAVVWGKGRIGLFDAAGPEALLADLALLVEHLLVDYHEANSF